MDPFIARMEAKRQAEWAARLAGKPQEKTVETPSWFARAAGWWTTCRNIVLNVVGALIFVGASLLLCDAVMQPTIAIAPLSVPEALEKTGYTSGIAANELRAALQKIVKDAASKKDAANIAGRADIPDIVVPRTGLSVETIAAQIRKLLGFTNRWQVAGGIWKDGDQYALHLKLANDREARLPSAPIRAAEIALLLDKGAREILGAADPYLLAASYLRSDPDKSEEFARQIIAQDPGDEAGALWAHNLIGAVLRKRRDFDGAIAAYGHAIAFQQKRTALHAAFAAFAKALFESRIDLKYAVIHNNLGTALDDQGKREAAIDEYGKAIELDPKYASPHNGLGNVLRAQRKSAESIAEYKKAIELDPKYAMPHNNLGNALREQGKSAEAIAEYKKAIELDPKDAFPHNGLGAVLTEQGKTDEAIAEYRRAIELDPKVAFPHNGLGAVLREQGKTDEAIAEYRTAIELDPKDAGPHNNLGNILREQGKTDEAIAEYKKAIELDPKYALPHYNVGLALRDAGALDEAIAEFRRALELKPESERYQSALDVALADRRERDNAKDADKDAPGPRSSRPPKPHRR